MSKAQIALAKTVLVYEGTLATLALTLRPMLVGGVIGTVFATLIAVLDFGLQFAEGKITQNELLKSVVLSTVIAGGSTVLIMGLVTGLAVVVPNLLPILLAVVPALSVVSFVFLAYYLQEMGEGWWIYLEEQGVLEEFLEGLVITESIVSEMARKQSGNSPLQNRGRRWTPWSFTLRLSERLAGFMAGLEVRSFIPDFDYARFFPDIDLDLELGKYVPEFEIREHLPDLDFSLLDFLRQQGLSVIDDFPRPNFFRGTEAAQGALKSASAYLNSQASDSR